MAKLSPKNKSVLAKRQKTAKRMRAVRTMVRSKKRRRVRTIFGYRYGRPASSLIIDYLEYGERLPKLEKFNKLKPGALVKVLHQIDGRTTRPRSRDGIKSCNYLMRILVELPKGTQMMFLERHSKFPEWFKFCVIGGRPLWVDISHSLDFLSIMRKPVSKKKKP